jgi:tetratricopeptide (TPR) repeat protein
VESYNNFGNVLNAQGRLEEAQKQFRQALALRPSYAEAHFNLANTLLSQGRTDEAIMYYQQAVELVPRFPRAHFQLAQALLSQGKLAEAEASYRQTLALEPNWADAHRSLGNVLRGRKRLAEAEAFYRRAHEIAPQACEGLLEWAELLDLLGRADEGLQVRAHLCNLAPQSARHWFELGLALQRISRPADARDAYLRGQAIDPHSNISTERARSNICRDRVSRVGACDLTRASRSRDVSRAAQARVMMVSVGSRNGKHQ